jgi:hypothetical protein
MGNKFILQHFELFPSSMKQYSEYNSTSTVSAALKDPVSGFVRLMYLCFPENFSRTSHRLRVTSLSHHSASTVQFNPIQSNPIQYNPVRYGGYTSRLEIAEKTYPTRTQYRVSYNSRNVPELIPVVQMDPKSTTSNYLFHVHYTTFHRRRLLGPGSWVLGPGSWVLGPGWPVACQYTGMSTVNLLPHVFLAVHVQAFRARKSMLMLMLMLLQYIPHMLTINYPTVGTLVRNTR